MKTRLIVFLLVFCATLSFVRAQDNVRVVGSGTTGTITPDETVTGEILNSASGSAITPISFIGRNGSNRVQGDFDVWYFDAVPGENYVIRVTATRGNLRPTLLLVAEGRIPTISALDTNADEDASAGLCLWQATGQQYAILVHRQPDTTQSGDYDLTLTAATGNDLSGGSATTVCSAGTFVTTLPNTVVNIRAGNGLRFRVIGQMQPNQPYWLFGPPAAGGWRQIGFFDDGEVRFGYVSERYTRIMAGEA
ncbi:MAG: hypothetical protein HZC41_00045 [Chloroflexi bacterium]|nr:hypothetical protein [Chloroflexota bacterium]